MYTIHTMYEIPENEEGKSSLRLKEIISNALKKKSQNQKSTGNLKERLPNVDTVSK